MAFVIKDHTNTVELYREFVTSMGTGTYEALTACVSKGMVVVITYNMSGATQYFKFIYAKGCEPQS